MRLEENRIKDNIIKLPCSNKIAHQIYGVLERLQDKGFNAIFNGHNFDLIDDKGRCLNSEWGIDFELLEEYSLLEHYFTIGEKVVITNTRSKTDLSEWLDDDDDLAYREGAIGFIKEVASGDACGIGRSILFKIEITEDGERYTDCFIPGDFELV